MRNSKPSSVTDPSFGARLRGLRPVWGVAIWLALATPHSALRALAAEESPAFFEPKEHYYKARGSGITVRWEVEPKTVPEGEQLAVTLVVQNVENPHQVVRPDLRKLDEFGRRFQIENGPDQPIAEGAKEVRFAYRLRPRTRGVDRVPILWFAYYNPAVAAEDKRFPKTKAAAVEIQVTAAAPKPPPPPVPLNEPEHLFAIETGPRVLERQPFAPDLTAWLVLFALGLLLGLGWYVVWRRVYPDAVRLARLRRGRAARRTADAIRRAGRTPDPPAAIAVAVLGYLRARFPLAPGAETPTEIGDGLRAAGLAEADTAIDFFRRCDAARFAPASDTGLSLAADAESLIARLEALG